MNAGKYRRIMPGAAASTDGVADIKNDVICFGKAITNAKHSALSPNENTADIFRVSSILSGFLAP